jgi:hypothetical protein
MNEREELRRQQRKEALEELQRHWLVLRRLKKLLLEEESYEPAALEESANTIIGELVYHGRRMAARLNLLVCIRNGRIVYGKEQE